MNKTKTFAEAVMGEKHEELLQVLKYGLCGCGYPGEGDHYCPYQIDINGDDTVCNCCKECTSECGNDI